MTYAKSEDISTATHREQWPTTLASLAAGAGFLGLWFWLLPKWLGLRVEAAGGEPWRWLAAIPSALGFAVALRCIWDFGWTGRGLLILRADRGAERVVRGTVFAACAPFKG